MSTALADPAVTAQRRPEPERDRWGRYLIPDPETGKRKAWTRATTFASSIADTYNLGLWQQRMTALGLAQRPDLLAAVASTHVDDKDALNKLCEGAKEHAGSSTSARLGTALHAFAEQVDAGESPRIPAPWDADIAAYQQKMAAAGVTFDRAHIERIVVVPEFGVAGTFDRLALRSTRRLLEVGDLKTGKDLSYSWTEIAVQLALYAHATHIFDVATGLLEPMPEVDLEQALVMWLPVGQARCELYEVDIAAGWETAQLCHDVREWRKRKDLATLVVPLAAVAPVELEAAAAVPPPAVPGLELVDPDGIPVADAPTPVTPDTAAPLADDPFAGLPDDDADGKPQRDCAARTDYLRARVVQLDELGHGPTLGAYWPDGVPGFTAVRDAGRLHTNPELDAIEAAIVEAEKVARAPFPDTDPSDPAHQRVEHDDPRLVDVRTRAALLPADLALTVPGALTGTTETALYELDAAVAAAEHTNGQRIDRWNAAAAVALEHGCNAALLRSTIGAGPPGTPVAPELLELADLIADALHHPDRHLVVRDGALVVDQPKPLIDKHGGRSGVQKAAKEHADRLGRAKPRSTDDALADLVLVAALVAT